MSYLKFLRFVIWFYRTIGVSFGGISLDRNGLINKTKFWMYFGYFGIGFYIATVLMYAVYRFYDDMFKNAETFVTIKVIVLSWQFIKSIMILSICFINQKYGHKIINILIEYEFTKLDRLKKIAILWCIHLMIFSIIFCLTFSTSLSLFGFILRYYNNIIFPSLMYSISFMSWIISTKFVKDVQIIRTHLNLNDNQIITPNLLIEANKLLAINFLKIKQVDQYLAIGFFSMSVGIIFSFLEIVYLIICFHKYFLFLRFIPFQTNLLILLVLNCVINGNVMEETVKLLNDLDNLIINVNNDKLYHAIITFKTSINKLKCGFTIGGFASWNMLTMLHS